MKSFLNFFYCTAGNNGYTNKSGTVVTTPLFTENDDCACSNRELEILGMYRCRQITLNA